MVPDLGTILLETEYEKIDERLQKTQNRTRNESKGATISRLIR